MYVLLYYQYFEINTLASAYICNNMQYEKIMVKYNPVNPTQSYSTVFGFGKAPFPWANPKRKIVWTFAGILIVY